MIDNNTSADRNRLHRIHEMRMQGIEPYAHNFERSCNLIDIRQDFSYVNFGGEEVEFNLCGRVMGFRHEGGMLLVEIEEQHARLQFALTVERFDAAKIADFKKYVFTGDYIGFSIDKIYRLRSRELAARAVSWTMLAPCLIEPPFDEPFDKQRYRHLQLALESAERRRFATRGKIVRFMRRYIEDQFDFLEMAIPAQSPDVGRGWYRSHYKRLLVGGIEAVYEIASISGSESEVYCGLPHSQLLDCYRLMAGMEDMMRLAERLICDLALEFSGNYIIPGFRSRSAWHKEIPEQHFSDDQDSFLDLTPPWAIHSFYDIVRQVTGIDFLELPSVQAAVDAATARGFALSETQRGSVGEIALDVAVKYVFPTLIQPAFVTGYPIETHVESKRNRQQPRIAAYFEVFANGARLACGKEPITDPAELESLLASNAGNISGEQRTALESLHHALQCGLPPLACLHISIERLIMLLTNSDELPGIIHYSEDE